MEIINDEHRICGLYIYNFLANAEAMDRLPVRRGA